MGEYSEHFKKERIPWLYKEGWNVKSKVLQAVYDGNTVHIGDIASEYISSIGAMIGDNVTYAKSCAGFIFAQISAVATINGLSDDRAHRLKKGYYYSLDDAKSVPKVLTLINSFILDFTEAVFQTKKISRYSLLVQEICAYIYLNIGEKLTVQRIADHFHFSESHVSHKFKKETGLSIMEYFTDMRISEAKIMLHQNISIVEISNILGFTSQSHFSRIFRKKTGMTPGTFRKKS